MAATALVASLVAVVGSTAATSPAAAAAPLPALALDVVSARTAGPKPDFAQKGDVVTDYKFLVQKIEAGDPTQSAAYCLPMNKGNAGASNANYPAGCNWPGTRTSNTGDPIVAQGTQDDVASVTTDKLADGHYIVSVKADGYEIGAGYFDVPLTSPVKVELQPYPLPLATIRVRVFQDIVPPTASTRSTPSPASAASARSSTTCSATSRPTTTATPSAPSTSTTTPGRSSSSTASP